MNRIDRSRYHAIKRAKERYQLELDYDDILFLERSIMNGNNVMFLKSVSSYRKIWLVRIKEVLAIVVYNKKQHCLSTFLPRQVAVKVILR